MEWWGPVLLVLACGAGGGLANAVMAGGERYRICLPGRVGKDFELGVVGPIVIGIVAAVVAYFGALRESSTPAQIVGCVLAGIGGANYLTNRIRLGNYRDAGAELASSVADDAEALAAEAVAEPMETVDEAPSGGGEEATS
jgi:hypothetical protein